LMKSVKLQNVNFLPTISRNRIITNNEKVERTNQKKA